MGDKGFVVTFRQTDPLFTLDLSVPQVPRIAGELKVPGYSTYIHPFGENHLLTVGVHIDAIRGWGQTPKISVFDVSDFANPKEESTAIVSIGDYSVSSAANWDHKAITFSPERNLLAIPASSNYGIASSRLNLYRVAVGQGIVSLGSVDMSDISTRSNNGCSNYQAQVQRSIFAYDNSNDQEHDYIYAIAENAIRSVDLKSPRTPLATVLFSDKNFKACGTFSTLQEVD
jgi:hypothetical protein